MARENARKSSNKSTKKPANRRPSQNRRRASAKTSTPIPGWLWLLTGIAVGALVMFLMHLSGLRTTTPIAKPGDDQPQTASQQPQRSEPATSADKDAQSIETADQPQTRLEFYELLKQSEVPVPEASAPPLSEQEPTVEYILQAGSFRDSNDANRMRAELILLNLEARIETIGIADGDIWHRVMVGPYSSRSQMAKARSTLASKNIAPLVYKKAIAPQS